MHAAANLNEQARHTRVVRFFQTMFINLAVCLDVPDYLTDV